MDQDKIMEEVDVAAGYGLAALALQNAILTKLALQGVFSPAEILELSESAEQMAGSGVVDASEGAVLIAQASIRGVSATWKGSKKAN